MSVHTPEALANCVSCAAPLNGPFCSACGERRFDHHALSIKHFVEHAFEAFTHLDGAIFRTLRALVLQPGRLTADWAAGRRKPYMPPVQLFLVLNVLFFIAQALNGWNTLTTNLDVHVSSTHHQDIAKAMVKEKLDARGITYQAYRSVFDAKAIIQAKSFVVIMVPLLAIFVTILSIGLHRFFIEHLVFSLHFYAFFLLYLSVASSLTTLVMRALLAAGITATDQQLDVVTSSILLACVTIYLAIAVRAVYRHGRIVSFAKGLALCYVVLNILYLYRFLLFLITFRST